MVLLLLLSALLTRHYLTLCSPISPPWALLMKQRPVFLQFYPQPKGDLAMSRDIFGCYTSGVRNVLLTSSRSGPGMLLDVLQSTGQPLQQKIIQPKMSIVMRLRKLDIDNDAHSRIIFNNKILEIIFTLTMEEWLNKLWNIPMSVGCTLQPSFQI